MSSYIGLLRYNESNKRGGEEELAVGRAVRATIAMEGRGARCMSILWNEGPEREVDVVVILEAQSESLARNIFKTLGEQRDATVSVMPAFIKWEKELVLQNKPGSLPI